MTACIANATLLHLCNFCALPVSSEKLKWETIVREWDPLLIQKK